jgi:hypothetical protein
MMSQPARQQRALDRIEKTLLADDPGLGSMFAIFTRLTRHEAMPMTERVRTRLWQVRHAAAVISIALVAVLSVLIISWLAPSRAIMCSASPAAPGHGRSSSRTNGCQPAPPMTQGWLYVR